MSSVEKLKFKICVLGDASVGKTSLIHHFCEGYFRESYLSTIGVAFLTKSMDLEYNGKQLNVVLQIWDIGGQDLFSRIRQNYLKGSQGAFVMFDVTNRNTLMHIDAWIDELMRALNIKDIEKIPMIILGNKIDLDYDQRVQRVAENYIENQYNLTIPITYTSAKTGEGMNEAFKDIIIHMIETFGGI